MDMKKKRTFLLALVGLASVVLPLSAQNLLTVADEVPNSIVLVSVDEAGDELIEVMNASQLPHVHDPQTPRFVLTDTEGNYALGIGGYVRAVAEYDFGGVVNSVDFIPALIPNHSYLNSQIQMDATTANLYVKLVGRSSLLGNFVVHTEGNFRGSGRTFELRNAYLAFRGVTIGYTYGGFMDAAAMPATIDFQGPNGGTFYRTTQLSYTCTALQNFAFRAGIEMPKVGAETTTAYRIGGQRMPDFTLSAQYAWGDNSHIRVGGILRSMTYAAVSNDDAHSVTGYGVQASTTFGIGSSLRMFGQFTYGKGIGQYLNDLGELDVDLVTNPEKDSRMQALPMMGWFTGLQYNISPSLFLSATYSQSRLYSENGYAATVGDNYRYGQYLAANMFWSASNNMQFGMEYLHGWRKNFDASTRDANRISLMAKYSF